MFSYTKKRGTERNIEDVKKGDKNEQIKYLEENFANVDKSVIVGLYDRTKNFDKAVELTKVIAMGGNTKEVANQEDKTALKEVMKAEEERLKQKTAGRRRKRSTGNQAGGGGGGGSASGSSVKALLDKRRATAKKVDDTPKEPAKTGGGAPATGGGARPTPGARPAQQRGPSSPLQLVVAGGGPAGLIFSSLCCEYLGPNVKIRIYEKRIKKNKDGKWVWKNWEEDKNRRREQVVTLQLDVINNLSEGIKGNLFKVFDEEVWPSSRNIPIMEVEDRMIEWIQLDKKCADAITIVNRDMTEDEIKKIAGSFDIIVGADGGNSFVRSYFEFPTKDMGYEPALGCAYYLEKPCLRQSENIFLTISQTRYLINSFQARRGFLNIRLTDAEWKEIPALEEKRPFSFEKENTPLWDTIKQGLKMFNIPKESLKSVAPIGISLIVSELFSMELDEDFPVTEKYKGDNALAFVIGDAAFKVHFWPGRGLNSGIKAAVALARRCFWAYSPRGSVRYRDFIQYEGFMQMLSKREEDWRSLAITALPIEEALDNAAKDRDFKACKDTLLDEMGKLMKRLEARPDWCHQQIDVKDLETRVKKVPPHVINLMAHSGRWPLEEMAGEELNPSMMLQSPLKAQPAFKQVYVIDKPTPETDMNKSQIWGRKLPGK